MSDFSHESLVQRAFHRAAYVMHHMWEEKGSSDTRLLIPPLIPDDFVIVGESIAGRDHREHVIPRNIICYRCHEMYNNGATIDEVATFIRKNLKIVYISREEQRRLDSGNELNLRQRMPAGWTFETGDTYERLNVAGVKINFY